MKFVLANFKSYALHLLPYLEHLQKNLSQELVPYLTLFVPLLELGVCKSAGVALGAQNAYPAKQGAFTGEITLHALQELGISSILIGHSERRLLLGEEPKFCLEKFNFFKEHGFQIVFCIGESLATRNLGQNAVLDYLLGQLEGLDLSYPKLILAYEPIWAIGTGVSAQMDEIASTIGGLKQALKSRVKIVYGGSVQVSNADSILSLQEVDGVLVGKACLEPRALLDIINISHTKEFS
ncbi:Triosephosphate isomerase TpiA [Helicobacter sp. NHP19-003]|uniref:Triosephosphate isomerase n=1 Tax=Helicobacter gastrocanis TaxID=2849641 RepID=A0ABM7S9H5_9HELI|nr:triose-phosphate isomerase [Helicobacter sp. NHP19-003]BCZ17037.1 Triosephosphate isomerase TpiA [Helicobacter sp. NHP19-003]